MNGFVSLVGAGPGDPDLLTVRALRRLERAHLVLYDALVSPDLLDHAPTAHHVFVGKRSGNPSLEQADIHRIMIRAAHRGQRVVRLKAGDPCIFGRGGEEALALTEARVSFEIVPGVSSAHAGPTWAGIPLTHRGTASGFAVVTGHDHRTYRQLLDNFVPGSMTLIVLMGLASRDRIVETLLGLGWPASMPAAMVLGAWTQRSHLWRGSLADLGAAPIPTTARRSPGTLIIGPVVALAETIRSGRAPLPESPALPIQLALGGVR